MNYKRTESTIETIDKISERVLNGADSKDCITAILSEIAVSVALIADIMMGKRWEE